MDPQLQVLKREITDALTDVVTDAIKQLEIRVEERLQIHFEGVTQLVKLGAEGYGATLQKIERELADLNKKVDIKFADHDLVLSSHNIRITKLERRR